MKGMKGINIDFFKHIKLLLKFSNLRPRTRIKSIFELPNVIPEFCKGIVFDVDQTLVVYGETIVQEPITTLVKTIKERYKCCLLSNYKAGGKNNRLEKISELLDIKLILSKEKKPSPVAFHTALSFLQLKPHEVVMVGDRIFTDIMGANAYGLYTVLQKPIAPRRDPFFYVQMPRFIERALLIIVDFFIKDRIND